NSVPGLKFHRRAYVLVHRLSYPVGNTRICVRAAIGIAHKSPIWNRHFDPVDTRSDSKIFSLAPKFLSESVVAGCRCDRIWTPLRSNGHNFRSVIGIAYKTPIRNRHSETLVAPLLPQRRSSPLIASGDKTLFQGRKTSVSHSKIAISAYDLPVSMPTISPFPWFSRGNVSLDHVNPGRGNHIESACHDDRKLCSTRRENSCPGR
ncbi:hypothetical protein Taro_047971, partial [Colocasia esculenta]|nr:hypothetical protein [Colocasia esculenta]